MNRLTTNLFIIGAILSSMMAPARADDSARIESGSRTEKAAPAETAYVATNKAMIYSGPSEDYYPTQVLPQGMALEVYHQTDSGWLGIRPPGGSFSWVPASDAYLLPGGKSIEITSKNSVSWIGSSLGTAKQYRWQVRLNVGEQLAKIGEETIKDKDGKETLWYKIAPPNGEFRWIQSGAISRQPPANIAKQKLVTDASVVPASSQSKAKDPPAPKPGARSSSPSKQAVGKNGLKVRPANHVTSAQAEGFVYEGQVIEGQVIEGQVIDGQIIEGEVIDDGYVEGEVVEGEMIDGEVIDGEVVYEGMEGGEYIVEESEPQYDAHWNDWQLFEFTDDGLRLPFLERAAAWRSTQPDPLCSDPFSLEMAPKKKHQMRPGALTQAEPESRRRTPWRDPRELSQQRMMGYPQANNQPGSGATLSAIRDRLNSSQVSAGNTASGSIGGAGYNQTQQSSSGYYGNTTNPAEPRLAPPIDWSARNSNATGMNSLSPAGDRMGNSIGTGAIDLPVQPQDPFASGGTGSSAGSWTNRNWFGLGQQASYSGAGQSAGNGLQPMLNAGGQAVQQLQQRLSEMVTQPMQHWNFGDLKQRVQYYISNGSNPAERGQARLLLERIDEFERHAMRSGHTLSSLPNGSMPTNSLAQAGATAWPSTGASPAGYSSPVGFATGSQSGPSVVTASYIAPSSAANSGTMPSGNFDATGWLVPVSGAGPKHPAYALLSDSGQIVAYVTALPGMNLERYIDQAVGINGLRGYLPEFQAAHVEAQNITRLR